MKTVLKPSGENSFWVDAFRDLVIVVVGILVALWLESWWQERQDRREERQILSSLGVEFRTNAAEVENRIRTWRNTRRNRIDTHATMGGPSTEEALTSLEAVLQRRDALPDDDSNGGFFFFDPRHGQLTSVINSGKLGLISNRQLRAKIADWPTMIEDHDWDEQAWIRHESDNLYPALRRHLSMWEDSRFDNRLVELHHDFEFDNNLRGSVGLLTLMIGEGEAILAATNDIIDLIEQELETLH
jgi:hypothetical protein